MSPGDFSEFHWGRGPDARKSPQALLPGLFLLCGSAWTQGLPDLHPFLDPMGLC